MTKYFSSIICGITLLFSSAALAQTVATNIDPFTNETPMSSDELQSARGGFMVNGYDIQIGATITLLDGTVHSFASDTEAFIAALYSFGLDDRAERLAGLTPFNGTDLETVFTNSLNDQVFTQQIEIDVLLSNFEVPLSLGRLNALTAVSFQPVNLPSF